MTPSSPRGPRTPVPRRRFLAGMGAAAAAAPNRPPNIRPADPANPEGNWTDQLGHFVTRSDFGQWITYDDSAGLAGGSKSPFGDFGPFPTPRYPDIELLRRAA